MEFPSFNHHNRYVPHPPPKNFSGDHPNLYPHNHHHRHLPPPHLPPPPPPPLSYHSLPPPPPHPPLRIPPPPPSYNPHQSHFTFLDAQNPSILNHTRSSPPQTPRFSNPSHRFDYRSDSWSDPRRVLPEPPHRNPILPEDHHHRLYSPNPPSESYYKPRDLERSIPSSRYRDDGYARRDISNIVKQDQQDGRIIDRYASAHSVLDVGKSSSANSRNLEDFVEKYEPRYISENDRVWDRQDPRWVHATNEEKNEFNHGGDDAVREQSRDYGYESSKFNRVREGREEFKQVQKKSVLLRIGKLNNPYRNRIHDQHFSKPYVVESNNNFRGKDKDKDRNHTGKDSSFYLDQRMEGERGGSPVELDVSFKSNSLVAKAVVTPSSPLLDSNHTRPRNGKIKRVTEFDSPLTKFSERAARFGSSEHGSECPSSSEKTPKQLRDKDSPANGVDDSLSGPVLDQAGGSGGSDGPLSFRLRKKRKVINLGSRAFNFHVTEKYDKPVNGENIDNSPTEHIPSATLCPSESEKDGSEFDSVKPCQHGNEADISNPSLCNIHSLVDDTSANKPLNDLNVQPSQNEVSQNLENDTQMASTDGKAALGRTGVAASSGQDQIEIQKCSTESYGCFNATKMQETSTTADTNCSDPCSDEIITIFHENGEGSRKEEETEVLEGMTTSADGSFTTTELKETVSDSCIRFNSSTPSETHENVVDLGASATSSSSLKQSSEEEDEVTEMVKLTAELVQTPSPEHREPDSDQMMSDPNIPKNDDENTKISMKTSHLEVTDCSANTKTASSASRGCIVKTQGINTKLPMKKPISGSAVSRAFTRRTSPVFTNSNRTWHRTTSNPASSVTKPSSIPVPAPPKPAGTGKNSYIRSGNTLVRKAVPQLNPSGQIEARTGGSSAFIARPKTPPLSTATKLPDLPSSPLEQLPIKGNCDEAAAPACGNLAAPKASEDQNSTPSNSDSQKPLDDGAAGKKIQYVKRKSNQLVAASSSDHQPVQDLDKTQDSYYKRRKNQLIRTSVGDDDSANMESQRASKINIKRQPVAGISKKYKHLKFSSVWTLNSQSLGKDGVLLRQKLMPHLIPWKRSRNWGNTTNISSSIPDLSSSISRKLLLSRKRGMIYTKSRHGFSLRMSKLLSVGGSSLKWSKSIERNSKRVNEEATLAVAAVEKKKREQHGSAHATAEIKSRNNMSRDRIFRIGSVRYKMDPSRRTLQRISGDEERLTSKQSNEDTRKSYIPKRLLIGHDEYVRIGNGNQLVRNPKRRTRIFANEKVRWSLHTARSRLAKKRKYCQFFTRFGKCNKDDGKCPYIHDSSKIAVCTKFLNGLCSDSSCKLTHKVIPERMQDCSYFSQGLCSNEHCPYRHVNVNSAASICEGFLKGYCADGNECRKKHTYACPLFEATGTCSQGSKCKLHHPKNRNTGSKRKQQDSTGQHQKNSRGRYFGFVRDAEAMQVSEKHYLMDDDDVDILCQEGKFAEYIGLDFGNEEGGDTTSEPRTTTSDVGAAELDELIKPLGIMNKIELGVFT